MNDPVIKTEKSAKKSRGLLIFVCIFVAFVLIFGAILTTITVIRQQSYVVRYGGRGVNERALSYLALFVRYTYLSRHGVPAARADAFWQTTDLDGNTHAQLLAAETRRYLAELLVCADLLDRAGGLTAEEKGQIDDALADTLTHKAGGSEKAYDEAVLPLGFDFCAVREAYTLQYKASLARARYFGEDGSGIASESDYLRDFLLGYAHVDLLFLPLTDGERIENMREAIRDGSVSPEMFALYVERYNQSGVSVSDGFYFFEGSVFTAEYAKVYPTVPEKALSMQIGAYDELPVRLIRAAEDGSATETDAICFLHRTAPSALAYLSDANAEMFSDFYRLASVFRFAEARDELTMDVVFTDRYDEQALARLPLGAFSSYYVRF